MAETLSIKTPWADLARRGMRIVDGKLVQMEFIDTGTTTADGVPIYALVAGGSASSPSFTRLQDGDGLTLADIIAAITYTVDGGVATGAQTSTTLKDTSKAWTIDQLAGMLLTIHLEDGATPIESQTVVSNTADTITLGAAWANDPVTGVTHYKVTTTGNALLVKGADITIDAEEINISNVKVGHYKSAPPDLADNQDSQMLLDIKGRTIVLVVDGAGNVAAVNAALSALQVDVKTPALAYDGVSGNWKFQLELDNTFGTFIYDGSAAVPVPGTSVPLNAGVSLPIKRGVTIVARKSALVQNTGTIWVGGPTIAAGKGTPLEPGDSTFIETNDVAKVYIDANVAADGVCWRAE